MESFVGKLGEQVAGVWKGMDRRAKLLSGVALGVLLGAIVILVLSLNRTGTYQVLFSNLQPTDAAEVVAYLREQGVSHRLERNGSEIWVPEEHVAPVRLDLAAMGLPKGGVVGFEAFDTTRLGMTDFERQVQYQRALQGELTRTIRAFDQVQDARVHIALPERSLFIREQGQPSASVVLQLAPGRTLESTQVQAIVHLLARSVEGLNPDNVTVVDTRGNVLSDLLTDRDTFRSDVVARQLEVARLYEERLSRDLESLLSLVFGPGRAVARVRVELGFDSVEEMSESFSSPTDSRTGLARSEQRTQERYEGELADAGGVVGVDANIPGYVENAGSAGSYELIDETINYELNRIVATRQIAPGEIRRLSVAVIIDAALDEEARAQISEIAAAAVGLDPTRGDVVSVQSMQFETPSPMFETPEIPDVSAPNWLPYILLAIVGVVAGTLLVVTMQRRRRQPTVDLVIPELETAEEADVPLSAYERRKRELRSRVHSIAQERPKDVAQLIRAWLAED